MDGITCLPEIPEKADNVIIKNLEKLGKNRKKEIDSEAINENSGNAKTLRTKNSAVTEDNAAKIKLNGEKIPEKKLKDKSVKKDFA